MKPKERLVKQLYFMLHYIIRFLEHCTQNILLNAVGKLGDAEAMFFHNLCGHVTDNLELTKTTTTAMSVD